jgi:murein DD-endopeptidase MepM/ murein hydrolase activator NlpD
VRRILIAVVLTAVVVAGGAWFQAGRAAGPAVEFRQPGAYVGQATALELAVEAEGGVFSRVDVTLEQGDASYPVFTLNQPAGADLRQESADRLFIIRPIGADAVPELVEGQASIVVRAARPVLFGLREAETVATHDVTVRLEPPRVAVLSTLHYVNHGGSEFVVYRATPSDVESGVRVGDITYPGFPAAGAGIPGDDSLRIAFFALLHDQDLNTPIELFASDPAGNEASAPLTHRAFPREFARSRITLPDSFLTQVVPLIVANTPGLEAEIGSPDPLDAFLYVNGQLRRRNNATIAAYAEQTAPEMLWGDAFQALGNASVEARFADYRTYLVGGEEVDQQVHLGFDLAVTSQVPITSAHRGRVVHAGYLGIYGNCVIVDHGLGVQSLYAHLSSIEVGVGDAVDKGQTLGRSGQTGLAGGDHLHFTMLVGGQQVNPIEWWDPQWMQDRVLRKIADAGGTP